MEMDENIYANVDDGAQSTFNCGDNWNCDTDRDQENQRTTNPRASQKSGPESAGRRYTMTSVVQLLMCVLLLSGVTVLWTKYNNLMTENNQLQTSYKNLTDERNQLQTSYKNLTDERNHLQTSYKNLTDERNQLQTSYKNLTDERNQLQTSYKHLTDDRNQLQTRCDTTRNQMAQEKDNLQKKLTTLVSDMKNVRWILFSTSIYHISSQSMSWDESRKACRDRGADLVIINSQEEENFIRNWINGKPVWIGLSDGDTEGQWKWVDGSLLSTRNWYSNQPNGGKTENCALHETTWHDYPCNSRFQSICEAKI